MTFSKSEQLGNGRFKRDIIVVGASAGGVQALKSLVAGLSSNLPAAIFIVLHIAPHDPSLLPQILSAAGSLPAAAAVDGESWRLGRIYAAPPDHHLFFEGNRIRVTR